MANEVEYVTTGKFRALLCTSDKRMTILPNVPTIIEKGYDFACVNSFTWSVPVNTPKDIQKLLEKALLQAFADHDAREGLNKLYKPYDPLDGEATTKALVKDYEKFGELMKQLGLGIYKK